VLLSEPGSRCHMEETITSAGRSTTTLPSAARRTGIGLPRLLISAQMSECRRVGSGIASFRLARRLPGSTGGLSGRCRVL
jgi:hypothetical protein